MLLAKPEYHRDRINEIKEDIAYMPVELKKIEEENIAIMNEMQMTLMLNIIFYKISN